MLVLTRRIGDRIVIGDNTYIDLLSAEGNQIRLGVNAPKEVEVLGEELCQRIQIEKELSKNSLKNKEKNKST